MIDILVGATANTNYGLVSAIQVEEGPRLFYPHFGFFYKAKNTNVKVIFAETASGTKHEIKNSLENDFYWKSFSKNLSDVSFLNTAWGGSTKLEWQVCLELKINFPYNIHTSS